jgi:starch synthase/alpha-amylase
MAYDYEETRETNPVDFLVSGVFAAHFVNTVSPHFLEEIVQGQHDFITPGMRREMANKKEAGCAVGILNAPDPAFNPRNDTELAERYGPENHTKQKQANKLTLQRMLGLDSNENAPMFFWPSRLDPLQKGCQLLSDIFYKVISTYWKDKLQIVFVANGEYQPIFRKIVKLHNFQRRVAVCDFNESLEHLAYGASDFILMPSSFEPCGLPQMIAPIYGALPVAHDTGGIHDTISHLNVANNHGNGFLFETFDSNGLFWAISEAMRFYDLPKAVKSRQIKRIMKQSAELFNHTVTASHYIDLYEKMLHRPLINEIPYQKPAAAL